MPFVVDVADRYTAMHIFLWGIYEPELSLAFLSKLRPGMTVVDIGANKGYFSVLAARAVSSTGRIVSYEPLPRNFADLAETAARSGHTRWICRGAAVSSRRSDVMLRDSALDQGHSGWASVSPDGTIAVGSVTLDDEIDELGLEHIDVLKMDIEGHEAEALGGMRECLKRQRVTHLFIELHLAVLHEAEVQSVLSAFRDNGYRGYILLESSAIAKRASRLVTAGAGTDGAAALRPFTELSFGDAGVVESRVHMLWTIENR